MSQGLLGRKDYLVTRLPPENQPDPIFAGHIQQQIILADYVFSSLQLLGEALGRSPVAPRTNDLKAKALTYTSLTFIFVRRSSTSWIPNGYSGLGKSRRVFRERPGPAALDQPRYTATDSVLL
jgi:hypothetical protein